MAAVCTQGAALVPATGLSRGQSLDAQLISRDALFGNPVKAGAQISPDGQWLSWVAPVNGIMNVWVAPVLRPHEAKPVTKSTDRPIASYFWSGRSDHVLFLKDRAGDENFRLYGVNVVNGAQRDYTPFDRVRVRILGRSYSRQDELLIGLNQRDPRWHDAYILNVNSGKMSLVMSGDGYAGFLADDDLRIRLASRPNAAGGMDYFAVKDGHVVAAQPLVSTSLEDSATAPVGYTTDGQTLYWMDSRGRDTTALFAQDVLSGQRQLIGEDARADVSDALVDPKTGKLQAFGVNYLRNEWYFLDQGVKADWDVLAQKLGKGELVLLSRTRDDALWVVGFDAITRPAATYVYERKTRRLTRLHVSRPALQGAPLVPMHPVEIVARDGLVLPSYLTLPLGQAAPAQGKTHQSVPMVLLVHGGPWARDDYGFNAVHQWLANRGYAVLSVNFRASSGFGKRFLNAGNKQWGLAMHNDLLDAVSWAIQLGVTTADKVAIMGGSYGGYAALAGLAFTPSTFACGVDIVGPSNLETLLSTIPPYWEAGRQQMYSRMGDPSTPEGQALLRAASPLYSADQIIRPLLVGQGANDPRVKQSESDQIVAAMQSKNIPVTYVLFPDEGHGFAKPENNIAFLAITESFLGQCLGGRVEPMRDVIRKSTARIVHGVNHILGLRQAANR